MARPVHAKPFRHLTASLLRGISPSSRLALDELRGKLPERAPVREELKLPASHEPAETQRAEPPKLEPPVHEVAHATSLAPPPMTHEAVAHTLGRAFSEHLAVNLTWRDGGQMRGFVTGLHPTLGFQFRFRGGRLCRDIARVARVELDERHGPRVRGLLVDLQARRGRARVEFLDGRVLIGRVGSLKIERFTILDGENRPIATPFYGEVERVDEAGTWL